MSKPSADTAAPRTGIDRFTVMSEKQKFDLIILGAGPAGLSAAIYACRGGLDTLVIESAAIGGLMLTTGKIENYPGIPEISGTNLAEQMRNQALSFGAKLITAKTESVLLKQNPKTVNTDTGTFYSETVIIAVGSKPKKLGFDGEARFIGKGISYCAACDGFFFRNKHVFVVGGGNSAAEEALFLATLADKVTMIVRRDKLRCEAFLSKKLECEPKLEILYDTELIRADGETVLEMIEVVNKKTGEHKIYRAGKDNDRIGLFIFVGYTPSTSLFKDELPLDKDGYIIANERCETALNGVYAIGDVRTKSLRQVITAAADGAIAAKEAAAYVATQK